MYLSKVTLIHSPHTHKLILDLHKNGAYSAHQLLWKLFTQDNERSFLFREENNPQGLPQFLVLSHQPPLMSNPSFQVETKHFTPKLHAGSRLAFKLRSNPTVAIPQPSGRSKRHDVLMHAKHLASEVECRSSEKLKACMETAAQQWLNRPARLEQWGISLDALPDIESYTQHKAYKKGVKHPIRFSSVDYQGILTVQNPELFLTQYAKGFGRAKAMGCGLMLIRRI